MTITVTDFEKITGISRHTVYAWFYRQKFPKGIKAVKTLGAARMLSVKPASEHYESIAKELVN